MLSFFFRKYQGVKLFCTEFSMSRKYNKVLGSFKIARQSSCLSQSWNSHQLLELSFHCRLDGPSAAQTTLWVFSSWSIQNPSVFSTRFCIWKRFTAEIKTRKCYFILQKCRTIRKDSVTFCIGRKLKLNKVSCILSEEQHAHRVLHGWLRKNGAVDFAQWSSLLRTASVMQ